MTHHDNDAASIAAATLDATDYGAQLGALAAADDIAAGMVDPRRGTPTDHNALCDYVDRFGPEGATPIAVAFLDAFRSAYDAATIDAGPEARALAHLARWCEDAGRDYATEGQDRTAYRWRVTTADHAGETCAVCKRPFRVGSTAVALRERIPEWMTADRHLRAVVLFAERWTHAGCVTLAQLYAGAGSSAFGTFAAADTSRAPAGVGSKAWCAALARATRSPRFRVSAVAPPPPVGDDERYWSASDRRRVAASQATRAALDASAERNAAAEDRDARRAVDAARVKRATTRAKRARVA